MMRAWMISVTERIDSAHASPLYLQIIQTVIADIQSGRLAPGAYLPSTRILASQLEINRKTVVLAYEDLVAQGWLSSSSTRGTSVCSTMPEYPAIAGWRERSPAQVAAISYRFDAPPDRPMALPDGIGLKLDEGAPDGRLFPPELLVRAHRTATNRLFRDKALQYRSPRGMPELRAAIADMLNSERGLKIGPDNICITRGSQHGIFLASLALIKPGDIVLVESLSYEPAIAAFERLGARIIAVGLDDGGIDVDEIEDVCRNNAVRAIFVTPHHQFPTTVTLRPDRRLRLIELAHRHGFVILEDDYDHEFHFQSQPLLPIAAHAPGQTIYVGSMSKLLLPALRVGYLVGPTSFIDTLAHLVSLSDGMGNSITEAAVATLITNGELKRHARKARQIYAERREFFARSLGTIFGDAVQFKLPDGGLAFWLRFETDLDELEQTMRNAGLRFASSRSFMFRADAPRGLRIGFASLNTAESELALQTLAAALE
jgi:GntR family transcriptional regulator / MocR family aminotransferase